MSDEGERGGGGGHQGESDRLRARRQRPAPGTAHLPLARGLRSLHQALMRAEAGDDPAYANPYTLFFALTNEPRFAWLRSLSELMAELDGRAMQGEFRELAELSPHRVRLEQLLGPRDAAAPEVTTFRRRYLELMQASAEVATASGEVRRELARVPAPADA